MKIYLIRHAESVNNVFEVNQPDQYKYLRVADPDITDLGRQQALMCRELLTNETFGKGGIYLVFTSPMLRTLQTAKIIFENREVPVEVDPDIYEVGGVFQLDKTYPGMGRSEIAERFPEFSAQNVREDGYFFEELWESRDNAYERAKRILEKITNMENNSIAFVTHGLLIGFITKAIKNEPHNSSNF